MLFKVLPSTNHDIRISVIINFLEMFNVCLKAGISHLFCVWYMSTLSEADGMLSRSSLHYFALWICKRLYILLSSPKTPTLLWNISWIWKFGCYVLKPYSNIYEFPSGVSSKSIAFYNEIISWFWGWVDKSHPGFYFVSIYLVYFYTPFKLQILFCFLTSMYLLK